MSDYQWWADLPHDKHHVKWESVPGVIASLQHPGDEAGLAQAIAEQGLQKHLHAWIRDERVTVRNPDEGFTPVYANLPITGGALNRADLERFLNHCGVGLRISPPALEQAHDQDIDMAWEWTQDGLSKTPGERAKHLLAGLNRIETQCNAEQRPLPSDVHIAGLVVPVSGDMLATLSKRDGIDNALLEFAYSPVVTAMPPTTPEQAPKATDVTQAAPAMGEAERRLIALRAIGGDVKWWRGVWKITGINNLTEQEKGRPRSSQKTIRLDLIEAAEAEKREGTKPAWCP